MQHTSTLWECSRFSSIILTPMPVLKWSWLISVLLLPTFWSSYVWKKYLEALALQTFWVFRPQLCEIQCCTHTWHHYHAKAFCFRLMCYCIMQDQSKDYNVLYYVYDAWTSKIQKNKNPYHCKLTFYVFDSLTLNLFNILFLCCMYILCVGLIVMG